jgi:putative modified peptide
MNGEEIFVEIRISPRQAEELVDRLINDTGFRERLAQDPNAELRQYGISVPPALLPERVELPSPDELRQARDAMEAGELGDYAYLGPFTPGPFIPPFYSLMRLARLGPRG